LSFALAITTSLREIARVSLQKKILLVEDTPDLLYMLEQLLLTAGYAVLTASTGKAAFSILTTKYRSIDILVCDRTLPDADGLELATLARHLSPQMVVVLITGATGSGNLSDAEISVLIKPFPGRLLLEHLAARQASR
jgi:DNA-binding response OmpR family regulator